MIYIVAPHWMERVDECRMFVTYIAMETYVLTHAQQRKVWNADPDWCYVYAFDGDEMKQAVFQYYIKDGHLLRVPIKS